MYMKKLSKLLICMLIISTILFSTISASADIYWASGYVDVGILNVRAGAGTNYSVIDVLYYDQDIKIDWGSWTDSDDWAYICYYDSNDNRHYGWVWGSYIVYCPPGG